MWEDKQSGPMAEAGGSGLACRLVAGTVPMKPYERNGTELHYVVSQVRKPLTLGLLRIELMLEIGHPMIVEPHTYSGFEFAHVHIVHGVEHMAGWIDKHWRRGAISVVVHRVPISEGVALWHRRCRSSSPMT